MWLCHGDECYLSSQTIDHVIISGMSSLRSSKNAGLIDLSIALIVRPALTGRSRLPDFHVTATQSLGMHVFEEIFTREDKGAPTIERCRVMYIFNK